MSLYPKLPAQRQPIHTSLFGEVFVAGRVHLDSAGIWTLRDAHGHITLQPNEHTLRDQDILAVHGHVRADGVLYADEIVLLTRALSPPPATSPTIEALRARHTMMRTLRAYFDAHDFLEVETPNLVPAPGVDVHLEAFASRFTGFALHPACDLYLHTSPEFAMKTLLSRGCERIVQFCKTWRNGERTAQHNHEFTMAEWYRAYTSYEAVMHDVERVVRNVLPERVTVDGRSVPIRPLPFRRLTVCDAFAEFCDIDLLNAFQTDDLRDAVKRANLPDLCEGGTWEDLFHEILVTHIEPKLGMDRPTFLIDYPTQVAVLSRRRDDNPALAERFELYIAGVELCNGFTELNDPHEQRARFEEDIAARRRAKLPAYPMPEHFLDALSYGMPPSSGVALGLDRLLMLALGSQDIGDVLTRTTPAPPHAYSS